MTVEKRVRVGIGDIKTVVLECSDCGARLSFSPRETFRNVEFCSQCTKPWKAGTDDQRYRLIRMIAAVQAMTSPEADFSISIELGALDAGAPSML